jgi:formyltetrahydrofolate deformylase
VSQFLFESGANIVRSDQYSTDPQGGTFFMRVEFAIESDRRTGLGERFGLAVAERFGMTWRVWDAADRKRVVILVSRQDHCLYDLLWRWRRDELEAEVVMVISNHEDFRGDVEAFGLPYHHIPVSPQNKPEAEAKLLQTLDHRTDLIVLARYMQILSTEICKRVEGRMINIHHSFLPSFKGAKPYHQAHARGVKLVGATAHYVTPDLDEGPIIEQDVIRVDHTLSPERLAEAGRDVEAQVLARAVTWHAEHRVLLNGDRTVVFH